MSSNLTWPAKNTSMSYHIDMDNKYLEKLAKIRLSWWSQALDNSSDDLIRGKPTGQYPAGKSQQEVSRLSKVVTKGVSAQSGGVTVNRNGREYTISYLDGSKDNRGRSAPMAGYSNTRMSANQAERFLRAASQSRATIESGRGSLYAKVDYSEFKKNYSSALKEADRLHAVRTAKTVGKYTLGAGAFLGAGLALHSLLKSPPSNDNP